MKKREKTDTKNGSKNIYLLGGASLLKDVGSEMISPILPFYITALGGGGVSVGLLSGLREGLASLFKLLGGWASDRKGKRMPFVFLGYFISIIFRFLLSVANSWQAIIGFVGLERLGKSRDAPRDAIIAVSTKKRGRGFGLHQAMDTMGGIIGTIIVFLLFWIYATDFKLIILIAAGISALSLVPLFFVKEPVSKKSKVNLFKGIKNLNKRLKYFIFVASVFTIANFGLYMFLLLRARDITGSIIYALAIYLLFNIVWASLSIPFGNLSDKIGRKSVLMVGYLLLVVVGLGFAYFSGVISLIILFILYGLVYAITQSNQRALVSDLSGNMKGTAIGFYQAVVGVVNILAGVAAGILWDINFSIMFVYIAAVALLSAILLAFVREGNAYNS